MAKRQKPPQKRLPPTRDKRGPRYTPFDPATQGMGPQEMVRRTKQHNILATKQYESYKNLNLGVDAGWVNSATQGNEMNPWVMQKIGQMVGQQDKANKHMRAALKMWDTASKFETTKGSSSKKKQFIRHKEFGDTARTYSKKTRKGKAKRQGSYVSSYLDLSVAKTGKYGVDY